jgi:putative ABC transport system permease protein
MAVIPQEFGRIAWFRSDLLPHHWYEYLNLLAAHPNALLVSSVLKDEYYMEPGQGLRIQLSPETAVEGIIYAFVDYWPSFMPTGGTSRKKNLLVVGNYSYLIPRTSLEPYEVWISRDPSVTDREFYTDMVKRNIRMTMLKDSLAAIAARKSSPSVRGMNGVITVGFFITLAISFVGLLLCWVLSVRERTLQLGVIRALGLAKRRITAMLIWEQAIVASCGIVAGTLIGGIAGQLFVPILHLTERIVEQVPPLQIGALFRDYAVLFGFLAFMLLAVLTALQLLISRLRVSEALKLGEE